MLHKSLRISAPGRSLTPTPASKSLQQSQVGLEDQETVIDCPVKYPTYVGRQNENENQETVVESAIDDCTQPQREDSLHSIGAFKIQIYIKPQTETDNQATKVGRSVEDPTRPQLEDSFRSIADSEIQRYVRPRVSILSW